MTASPDFFTFSVLPWTGPVARDEEKAVSPEASAAPASVNPFEAWYARESTPYLPPETLTVLWEFDRQATLDLVLRLDRVNDWEDLLNRPEAATLDPLDILEHALICAPSPVSLGEVMAQWEKRYAQVPLSDILTQGTLIRLTHWAACRPVLRSIVRGLWGRLETHLLTTPSEERHALAWEWLRLPPHASWDARIWGALLVGELDTHYSGRHQLGWFDLLLQKPGWRYDALTYPFPAPPTGEKKSWWTDKTASQAIPQPVASRRIVSADLGFPQGIGFGSSEEKKEVTQDEWEAYRRQLQIQQDAVCARIALAWEAGLRPEVNGQNGHPLADLVAELGQLNAWTFDEFAALWKQWRAAGWRLRPSDRPYLEPVLFYLSRQPNSSSKDPLWWRLVSEVWRHDPWWAPEEAAELWDRLATWPGFVAGLMDQGDTSSALSPGKEAQRSLMAHLFPAADPGATAVWPVANACVSEQRAWLYRQTWAHQAVLLIQAACGDCPTMAHARVLAQLRQSSEPSSELRAEVYHLLSQTSLGTPYTWTPPHRGLTWPLFTDQNKGEFLATMQKRSTDNESVNAWVKEIREGRYAAKRALVEARPALPHLARLRQDFPHFDEVTDRIHQHLALAQRGDQAFSIPPLLLLGPAGVGKTFYFRELARAIRADYHMIHMEAINAGWALTGSESSWMGGAPGQIFETIMAARTANPIILFDEVDKCVDSNFPVDPVLLSLIEPHTAAAFTDTCLPLSLDLRRVSWVATANDLRSVSLPLQSRFDVVTVPSPDRPARRSMAQAIYRTLRADHAWGASFEAELFEPTLAALVEPQGSARDLRKHLTHAFASAALADRPRLLPQDLPYRPERPLPAAWDHPRIVSPTRSLPA